MKPDQCLQLEPFTESDWMCFNGANRIPDENGMGQSFPPLIGHVVLAKWPELNYDRRPEPGQPLPLITNGTVIVDALGLSILGRDAAMNLHWAEEDGTVNDKIRAYLRGQGLAHTLPDVTSGAGVPIEWLLTMGFKPVNFGAGIDEMSPQDLLLTAELMPRVAGQLDRIWEEQVNAREEANRTMRCIEAAREMNVDAYKMLDRTDPIPEDEPITADGAPETIDGPPGL